MASYEHISRMEHILDHYAQALCQLDQVLTVLEKQGPDYQALMDYYTSGQWQQDFLADEQHLLPAGLKRGVLSEDAVYDLLTEQRELAQRMLALANQMLAPEP